MRKRTIRDLPGPLTRDLTFLQNDLDRCWRCLPDLIERAAEAELQALDAMEAPARGGTLIQVKEGEYLVVVEQQTGMTVLERHIPGRYYLMVSRRERRNAGETEGGGRREQANAGQ